MLNKEERTFMAGRYGEIEQAADGIDPAATKSARLVYVCEIYGKLKRYDKLARCLDTLEKKIAAGDTDGMAEMGAVSQGLLSAMKPLIEGASGQKLAFDVTPKLWQMRAEMHIDLGDYRAAIDEAQKAIASLPPLLGERRFMFSTIPAGSEATAGGRVVRFKAMGVESLALALSGEKAAALKLAGELEALGTRGAAPTAFDILDLAYSEKQVGLARTYVALGEYRHAYDIVSKNGDSFVRGFINLASGGFAMEGGSLLAYVEIERDFMLHKAEMETGRLGEAKAGYDAMLQNPATADNGDMYWIVLYDRGRIAESEGDAKGAIDFYKRAVEVIERQRSTLSTEASKIGFVGNKQALYGDLVRVLVRAHEDSAAFDYVERSKARALVDMLASQRDFAVARGDAAKVRELLAQNDAAEMAARAPGASDPANATRGRVLQVREQLAKQEPELASLVSVSTLPAREIQSRLGEGETLVEYYAAGPELYAFVLGRGGLRVFVLDGANLPADVQTLRRALQDPNNPDDFRAPAQRMYARLVRPLEPALGGEKLIVVPHGALHYLPFGALHDGSRFLVESRSLRVLPAGSVLKFIKAGGRDKAGELLALGNPDLGDRQYDLQFAQAEAEGIVKGQPRSRALVRAQASETAFRTYASGFRFIHVASHGMFDPDAPLKSALLLARDAQNDGQLTVGELYSMRIDADLVTLSACETGLGRIASGDDVVGLTRGFLYAGASSIVASLWQVDDAATGELMSEFYAALRAGADKREALRRAQLAALKSRPHPFFWAPFQLTGSAD